MSSIRLLRTFSAVAAEGSFAAAAARVALTQAAVGQQMRALESDLRRPLFERQGKTVALNDAGRALVPQVRRLLALYDQMLAQPAGTEGMAGTVHLGAVVSAARPLIQATLRLKARHAGLDLHVSAAKSIELIERVRSGELDAALVVREPGPARPELAWSSLYTEPMVLLAPRKLDEAPPRQLLAEQPFLRFDHTQHTGHLVERTLKRLRVQPRELLELNALESIVELVRSGLGVALVPLLRDARWASDPKLRLIELPNAEERRIALVQRRDSEKADVVTAVAREFRGKNTLPP
ncbi:LysR family transcriptional regulator [Ramlibacter sp. G-1-2-2]|uniref:LysR family transcriptional regulator n=1 Tax=Ramlibacter agri TaxID=2728837 RepID=A0A848H3F8_9BURK|nr:LysR substrate-binding domain-containing protein [Ramlibacter agri]NML45335.1 LysR family transcriptional regulator [Ramlibacter agri]